MGMIHGMEWGGIDQMSPLKPEPTDYVRGMPGNETSRRGAITMDSAYKKYRHYWRRTGKGRLSKNTRPRARRSGGIC